MGKVQGNAAQICIEMLKLFAVRYQDEVSATTTDYWTKYKVPVQRTVNIKVENYDLFW